ncbi:MAG: DNA internalization-related competence protein ComEC/Rec2 [Blautia sp.]|nr:DNA internalization-related competence protein ComEC/Rec2 [Blautia sp.]
MGRRPVCILCLVLMVLLCVADWMGIPLIRGNPLPADLREHLEKEAEVSAVGEVERCADTEFSQSVYLKRVSVIYKSKKVSIGNLRVFLKNRQKLPAGSLILVRGILEEVKAPCNPGEFDSRQYYACRHIYYFMKKASVEKKSKGFSRSGQFLLDMREKFGEIFDKAAGESAAVFRAIVLGDKGELAPETKMRYQMAGIIHILAISGLHISVLGVGLYELLMRTGLGIRPAGLVSLTVMLGYGIMTGGGVSTMRAVIMFLVSVGAKLLGRIYDMQTALSLAAVLILLDAPAYLLDGGFWLSFGAVTGVGIIAPVFCGTCKVKGRLGKMFVSSLAVQVTTLPVMLWFYGEISIAGIFLNLLVLPTVGIVLGSGAAAALAGLGGNAAAMLCILPGRGLLWVYEELCELAEKIPFCTWVGGRPEIWQIGVYYAMLAIAVSVWKYRNLAGAAFVLTLLCTVVIRWRPEADFRITCLDIGQGDAIVVETPSGQNFLIDGGSSNKKGICQYQILPYLKSRGISRIDAVFISHTDGDHISGIQEFLEFQSLGAVSVKIRKLILPKWTTPPKEWKQLADAAESAGVQVLTAKNGDVFRGKDTVFQVISPWEGAGGENVNEEGMVMQVSCGEFKGLFTGDIGVETEEKLLETDALEDVDYLKVGHHGSGYSTGERFLQKILPEIAVISVSESNTYGHPSPEVIRRLEEMGAKVYCTKDYGAVTVSVGNEQGCTVRVMPYKKR